MTYDMYQLGPGIQRKPICWRKWRTAMITYYNHRWEATMAGPKGQLHTVRLNGIPDDVMEDFRWR